MQMVMNEDKEQGDDGAYMIRDKPKIKKNEIQRSYFVNHAWVDRGLGKTYNYGFNDYISECDEGDEE